MTSKDQISGFLRTLTSFFSRTVHNPFHSQTWVACQKSAYTKSVISVSALQRRSGNAIPEVELFYLTV